MNLHETLAVRTVIGLSIALLTSAAMAQSYRVEPIPLVSSDDSVYTYNIGAPSMNNAGDLVWTRMTQVTFPMQGFDLEYLGTRATLYRNGAYVQDIAPLVPGENRATAINDHGVVVGRSFSAGTEYANGPRGSVIYTNQHAFISQNGQATDLGASLGGVDYGSSTAAAINNQGQVVGYVGNNEMYGSDCCDTRQAFIYSHGQMTALGNRGGSSYASDINDQGVVVGTFFVPNENSPFLYTSFGGYIAGSFHAFAYQGGTMTDLSGASSIEFSYANAINNAGAIVGGTSVFQSGVQQATLFHNGVTTVLGSGEALDINDAGIIVGNSGDHGFVYRDGQMIDLSTLLAPSFQGWLVTRAIEINNEGTILAEAMNPLTGSTQYVQLSAVPEPQGVALMIAGLGIVGGVGRASRWRRHLAH